MPRILVLVWVGSLLAAGASAQDVERAPRSLLEEVMPGADRFEPADGDPPVKRAYRGDELLGYVFATEDLPPEEYGYSGPIRAIVGITPQGVLTGMRVTEYTESRMYEWGDFLREPPWFQEQFAGKRVGDRFRVNGDIDGISQVTITVRALALGVRGAARRVASAYASGPSQPPALVPDAELAEMSWYEMRRRRVAATLVVTDGSRAPVSISLLHLPSQDFAQHMLGNISRNITAAVEKRGGAQVEVLYVIEGFNPRISAHGGWSIEQGGRSFDVPDDDVVGIGAPGGGVLQSESNNVGVILLDDEIDVARPLTFVFHGGRDPGRLSVEYVSQAALARAAAAERVAAAQPSSEAAPSAPGPASPAGAAPASATGSSAARAAPPEATTGADAAPAARLAPSEVAPEAAPQPAPSTVPAAATAEAAPTPEQVVRFDVSSPEEEDASEGLLGSASAVRVGWVLLVLALATLAFLTKAPALRWVSLATTVVVLGWIDGGFLSISHVTGLIWVGPAAIMRDLPLLIMVAFTLVTLLLWGRVFCGFLCPFGALQDFIDRFVPRRFKRELPKEAHRMAWKAKYVILAIILLPAIAGFHVSLYQYFEPFATVFFVSRSLVLWAIAGSILVAAAVVPRFYCRYMCPLGAALALGSLLSFRRILRVEQCGHCKVCERRCPTGAIDGAELDFKECVRCNDCEVQLIHQAGVCRHDMEEIRPRLIQVRMHGHTVHEPSPLVEAR